MTKIATRKAKGKELENHVADKLVEFQIDTKARRDGASGAGNREKGDIITSAQINGRNLGIECKNHKVPHIKDWWEQTIKLEQLGREPILVYKLYGESMGESKAVVYLDTLLELIKKSQGEIKEIKEIDIDQSKLKFALQGLKYSINKVLKELN